ncbi:MAG: Crp/Fnr family transcriptional regulator [Lachnospiraceae bacterium]|nr:Crp/Fnr family transcriptional regulator [Lachnospiraceae bacterium]
MNSRKQFVEIISELKKEEFDYLSKLFQDCPDYVFQKMQCLKVKKGNILLRSGTPAKNVYIVLQGHLSGIDLQRVGTMYMFTEYSVGEVLGDFELFGNLKNYLITINASTDCELFVIPSGIYLKWMKQDINALFMRTKMLMHTLASETSTDRKNLFLDCKDRMIVYLVSEYEKSSGGSDYKLKKTQLELADRIGFNVRTIQRNIQILEKEEMIYTEGGKICFSREQYFRMKKYMQKNFLD